MNETKQQSKRMNFVILGAGGIGCYYGARLLVQGHGVTFVARGEQLKVLQQDGLDLRHPAFNFKGPVDALSLERLADTAAPEAFDCIIVCVKATATPAIASKLKGWFDLSGQSTLVLSLQNGIDNERQLLDALGAGCVLGGLAVRIGGHIIAPGVVEAKGVAQVITGFWPGAEAAQSGDGERALKDLVSAFVAAGIPTRQVDNIRHELWRKLVINNGVNPLSALTRLDTKSMSHHPEFGPIVYGLMKEAAMVAVADGEQLDEADAQEMYALIRGFDPIKTSMLVDLEKGRPLEIDAISGAVIRRANKLGLDVPYTETVYALLRFSAGNRNEGEHDF